MRGEDRSHEHPLSKCPYLGFVGACSTDPGHGPLQRTTFGCPRGADIAGALHLLGDVGKVEIDGEGACQVNCRRQIGLVQKRGDPTRILAGRFPNLFHGLQQRGTHLPRQSLAEQVPEYADLATQVVVWVPWHPSGRTGHLPILSHLLGLASAADVRAGRITCRNMILGATVVRIGCLH